MRWAALLVLLSIHLIATAQPSEKRVASKSSDQELIDALREIHNLGADLYNSGQAAESYRLFQGALLTARASLALRPADQAFIDNQLAKVEKIATVERRAFAMHETIVELRKRLRTGLDGEKPMGKGMVPEPIKSQPRELEPLPAPKKLVAPNDGVVGRLLWQGKALIGADVVFVPKGSEPSRVYFAVSDGQGHYALRNVAPGHYTVLLTMPKGARASLPERYAAIATSPLTVEVRGGGDTLDIILQ